MYNSGNMFGVTGHEIMKAITETTNDIRAVDEQQDYQLKSRQNLIQWLATLFQRQPGSKETVSASSDLACNDAGSL